VQLHRQSGLLVGQVLKQRTKQLEGNQPHHVSASQEPPSFL